MEDYNFIYYLIAFIVYILTRGKKKKQPSSPQQKQSPTKTFEELLKEITSSEGTITEEGTDRQDKEPKNAEQQREAELPEFKDNLPQRNKGPKEVVQERVFADDESLRIYEESIKQVESHDIAFEREDSYKKSSILKKSTNESEHQSEKETLAFIHSLKNGLDADEAKRAFIYSEILNRKY